MLGVAIYNSNLHLQVFPDQADFEIDHRLKTAIESIDLQDVQTANVRCTVSHVENDRIELKNFGQTIVLHCGRRLHRNQTVQLNLPASFQVGDTQVDVFDSAAVPVSDVCVRWLGSGAEETQPGIGISPGPETLHAWLGSLGRLQTSVAGSQEFFQEAARAVFNPGGLDGGILLKPCKAGWRIAASHIPYPDAGVAYRKDLVERCARESRTLYHDVHAAEPSHDQDDSASAVVSPVIDKDKNVIAIVYGFRGRHLKNNRRGIRPLEAQFVEVVANSVSAALIRFEKEAEAARTRVLLESAFSPQIAQELQSNPGILQAQSREVTVLFADLRRFTAISEAIGAQQTYEMLSDMMDAFSQIIAEKNGLIIDFYGDGISAFWNAPFSQANHATLACEAALEMISGLSELNEIWFPRIGTPLQIGVGVHTGIAQVGNSGSRTRLKYGPQGTTVNLASRLENVTKEIGLPFLVSADTACRVSEEFARRRICRTQLKGIKSTTDIYQLALAEPSRTQLRCFRAYECALEHYENGDIEQAIEALSDLQAEHPGDRAVAFLLGEASKSERDLRVALCNQPASNIKLQATEAARK